MRITWFLVFVHAVTAQSGFGRYHLNNSTLCQSWNCLNKKLNFGDALPPKDQYAYAMRNLLPGGVWQDLVDRVVKTCYESKTEKYTNTCPGQALLHCTVDQLIENCPSESWVQSDGCAPLSSVSGFPYMFSQSRYINLEENIEIERRPRWFLKNYFSTKCCQLPHLFNDTVLSECGFSKFIMYHVHEVQRPIFMKTELPQVRSLAKHSPKKESILDEKALLYDLGEEPRVQDPMDCCDMNEFIHPQWRSECGFHMTWDVTKRLTITNSLVPATTTTTESTTPHTAHDVKIVPLSCGQNTCIYKQLNVISDTGELNISAFTKLLDNLTNADPEWTKAKRRVVTKCLTKSVADYEAECQINGILKCTADILSENCPHIPKSDPCKHSTAALNGIICQISGSKFRPKNRHLFCSLPDLADSQAVRQCNASWSWRLEYEPRPVTTPRPHYKKWLSDTACKDLSESTTCLMEKMGVLNKYKFIDYFKMKDRIREFNQGEWELFDVYSSALQSVPLYREHCNTPKKLLNVLDSMMLTCPLKRRNNTQQCQRIFAEISGTQRNSSHIQHQFLLNLAPRSAPIRAESLKTARFKKENFKSNPLFDFGIFNSDDVPPVEVIDLQPKKEKPLVLVPVYQRTSGNYQLNQVNNDNIFRG